MNDIKYEILVTIHNWSFHCISFFFWLLFLNQQLLQRIYTLQWWNQRCLSWVWKLSGSSEHWSLFWISDTTFTRPMKCWVMVRQRARVRFHANIVLDHSTNLKQMEVNLQQLHKHSCKNKGALLVTFLGVACVWHKLCLFKQDELFIHVRPWWRFPDIVSRTKCSYNQSEFSQGYPP